MIVLIVLDESDIYSQKRQCIDSLLEPIGSEGSKIGLQAESQTPLFPQQGGVGILMQSA